MRRFQFSLRAALATLFVFAVALGTSLLYFQKLKRVETDIEILRSHGGNVDRAPFSQGVLSRMVLDFAGYPSEVRQYTPLDNVGEFIRVISRNSTISELTIDGTALSDSEVQRLLELPLTSLRIDQCPTGDTLDAPASVTLERLALHRTRLNDRSLAALGELANVRYLDLTRTRVSDASIEYLASRPSLTTLTIRRCKITEDGKRKLEALRPGLRINWEPLAK